MSIFYCDFCHAYHDTDYEMMCTIDELIENYPEHKEKLSRPEYKDKLMCESESCDLIESIESEVKE